MARTTEPAKLNDLPAEMICEVLRQLSLEDLVRLKMTAKRYLQIVSDFRVKQLDVGFLETSESIDHCQPTLFVLQFVQPTLSRLQQLTIDAYLNNYFDLNKLNRFTRLVRLKIVGGLPEDDALSLHLPNLRHLEIVGNRARELRVNSTKLEKLTYYGDGDLLQVKHPETVLSLDSDLPTELLTLFRNVRYLRSSSNLRILNESTLLDFPDLKEVFYTGTYDDVWQAFEDGSIGWEDIDELSSFLERFMAKKKALGQADLKVQFVSFELVDHKAIKDYKYDEFFWDYNQRSQGSFTELDLHVRNYDQLVGTFPIHSVDYFELVVGFRGYLPNDLFSKFVGIKRVEVNTLNVDEGLLLRFLQSVPTLKAFESCAQNLSESFFRQLAESCSESLCFLSLHLKGLERLRNLDFSSEFKALYSLTLKMNLSAKEIRWLLNMSWASKTEFHLTMRHEDSENKGWIEYAVTRILDSEEGLLYRGERRCLSPKQIRLRTCSLDCLGELADYFENL